MECPSWEPIWSTPSGCQYGTPHLGVNLGSPIWEPVLAKSRDWHVTDHYATLVGIIIVQNSNLLYCHYATLVDISLGRHDTLHEFRQTWLFYVAIISHKLEFA